MAKATPGNIIFGSVVLIGIHSVWIWAGSIPITANEDKNKKDRGAIVISISVLCLLLTIGGIVHQWRNMHENSGFLLGMNMADFVTAVINLLIYLM
jgi:hypothetical protein